MGLKAAINRLKEGGSFGHIGDPADAETTRSVARLVQKVEGAGTLSSEGLVTFVGRMSAVWERDRSLERVSAKDLRGACAKLFALGEGVERSLSDMDGFTDALADRLATKHSPSLNRSLLFSYLMNFDPADRSIRSISKYFDGLPASRLPALGLMLRECDALSVEDGPELLADDILSSDNTPREFWNEMGWPETLSSSRYAELCYRAFCDRVAKAPKKSNQLAVLAWADNPKTNLEQFPQSLENTAAALLGPWASSEATPSKSVERPITDFFVEKLKDPRFRKIRSPRWNTISEYEIVIRRWLNRASVLQFFDIVDESLTAPSDKAMWRYRRAFWTAYVDELTDAWVVFSPRAARMSLDTAQDTGDRSFTRFGQFQSGGQLATQSCLVMKIGDLTIAEWSHNGSCRMWRPDENPPVPYQKSYSAYELQQAPWRTAHLGKESYSWQRKFATKIFTETGLRRTQADYQVRR